MTNEEFIKLIENAISNGIDKNVKEIFNSLSSVTEEPLTSKELRVAFQTLKMSTLYSVHAVFELMFELNLIENPYSKGDYDFLSRKLQFLNSHRIIENPNIQDRD